MNVAGPAAKLPGFDLYEAELAAGSVLWVELFLLREELTMLDKAWSLWPFGCRHKNLSVPFSMEWTARQQYMHVDVVDDLPPGCSHYVVCLKCGRRFGYDWGSMKVIKAKAVKTKLKTAG